MDHAASRLEKVDSNSDIVCKLSDAIDYLASTEQIVAAEFLINLIYDLFDEETVTPR